MEDIKEPVKTPAPIGLEDLKKFFRDKTTTYLIDYSKSTLKGKVLLTYLSNLELPCDIEFQEKEDMYEVLKEYLSFNMMVSIPFLEHKVLDILLQKKGVLELTDGEFIKDNEEMLNEWVKRLDSLTLFNMYCLQDATLKQFVTEHETVEDDSLEGINFVSLLKNEWFYEYLSFVDQENLRYYKVFFNDYVFKGKNLFSYWAVEQNPMFLLTWNIAADSINMEELHAGLTSDIKELESVSLDQ